jgi:metallo-beta-lactamase family protein
MSLTISFLGASGGVTGSSYLLESDTDKLLVDCGLFQGDAKSDEHNYSPFAFVPKQIPFLILTHAHLDHCGLIPRLYREGFRGKIFSTPATFELTKLILADAAQIQENGANDHQLDVLFGQKDALGSFELFETFEYAKPFKISPNITATFYDAGHILGSAMVEVKIAGKTIAFSGDIGNSPVPILKDPTLLTNADYILCESTYGDRLHSSVTKRDQELLGAIRHAKKVGGKIIIPSFALERSQDLLYAFNSLQNRGVLPKIPIFLDSPLAIRITEVYGRFTKLFDQDFQAMLKHDKDLFSFSNFNTTLTAQESRVLNDLQGPAVYIAGSGMADAGRVQHHLKHHLSDSRTQVVMVGFCAPYTLGRKLLDGARRVNIRGHWINVRAQIKLIDSFSAHADQKGLLKWIAGFKTNPTVFLVHGEDSARTVLAEKVSTKLKLKVHMPKHRQTFEL